MTTDELFPTDSVASESPRLAWMKRHRILTIYMPGAREWLAAHVASPEEYAKASASEGEQVQWFFNETCEYGEDGLGIAKTEDEAIVDLAKLMRIPLWNEEQAAPRKADAFPFPQLFPAREKRAKQAKQP